MDGIVKDSSIWLNSNSMSVVQDKQYAIRPGMVREVITQDDPAGKGKLLYIVEVFNNNVQIPITCVPLNSFGGVYNYEEYVHRGYTHANNEASVGLWSGRPGDMVLVAAINGDTREGVILGGLQHFGRSTALSVDDGIAYKSVFNGITKSIKDDGSYTVTFNGMPTNISALERQPDGSPIPDPVYNTSIAGSYYQFDSNGSYTVSDAAQSNPQFIKIDKPSGKVTIQAGQVSAVMDKNAQSVTVTSKSTTINSTDSIKGTTKDFAMDASASAKIKSPQVALGTAEIELLDQISKLIDKLGAVQPISPMGPCTPLLATGQWGDVAAVQAKIKQITGKF